MEQKKHRRLKALGLEVQKINERIALYTTAADYDAPDVQLMLRQYMQLRRERYADYLQELIALDTHPKAFSVYVKDLVEQIYIDTDNTEGEDTFFKQNLVPLLKAV